VFAVVFWSGYVSKPWNHERNLIREYLISRIVVVSLFVHAGHVQAMCT